MAVSSHALALSTARPTRRSSAKASPPPQLECMPWDLPEFYAMIVSGDCLEPEISHGMTLEFARDAQYAVGDLVALFRRPELVAAGQHQVIVKRLVMMPPHWVKFPYAEHPESEVHALVVAEQLNPRRQFAIPCADLLAIHKCTGVVSKEKS